uniref:U45-Sparatoxin-Hju1a_2 n=1 Tax=Heteropoda jugulans TaxID=1358901 RepID=A0A4Q8K8L9_9ARAC
MKFGLALLLIASTVLIVQSEEDPEIRNDVLENFEDTRGKCADVYKSCGNGVTCCKDRPCKCNIVMDNCTCKKFLCELFGTCTV